jgi:integrase
MATVRKRLNKSGKVSWQIDYFDPNGKRIRRSFKKKKDAEAELGKRVSLIAENRYLDVKKDYTSTLGELIKKYEKNFKHQKNFSTSKIYYLANFKKYFGENTLLANINYEMLETYKNHLRIKPTRYKSKRPRKDSTINREMVCLRQLFGKAAEWGLVEQNPFTKGKSLLSKENNMRFRYLTEDEIKRLLPACPSHLRHVVECALLSGMRKTEILSLKWNQIKDGYIYLHETKSNESRQVPINEDLEQLFERIKPDAEGKQKKRAKVVDMKGRPVRGRKINRKYVFVYEGEPVKDVKTSFATACKEADIPYGREAVNGVTFHDLRHTFASHFVMRGGKIEALQQILGHKDIKTTLRYAHLSPEYKKKEVNLLNGLTSLAS